MRIVSVFRRVPPPIIGSCGVIQDRRFEDFEQHLDWLEAIGVVVERFDPAVAPGEVAARENVRERLGMEGDRCLPLVLVNGLVVSEGAYLSRGQLARVVGRARHLVRHAVARRLAAIGAAAAMGFQDEVRRQEARARESGIPDDSVRLAERTGARFRRLARTVPA